MHAVTPVERLVNLLEPSENLLFNMSVEEAIDRVGTGDAEQVRAIDGHFALIHKDHASTRDGRWRRDPEVFYLKK